MELTELRKKAKDLGIEHTHVKGEKTLVKELSEMGELRFVNDEVEETDLPDLAETADHLDVKVNIIKDVKKEEIKPVTKLAIDMSAKDLRFLNTIGFKSEWLASIANQYNFDRFQYMYKFKAFRCYQGNNQVDWISVNDLGMINERRNLTIILQKHQPLDKKKQVIKLPWR